MRILALAISAAMTLAALPAEAQSRDPFRATVKKRSYLDPGPIAPVGKYENYVNAGAWFGGPVYYNTESRFGAETLPPRIGAGRGPFCCF